MIISVSGASGAGKSSVISSLTSSQNKFQRLRSLTTRPRRGDDVSGEVDAISNLEFDSLLAGEKLAWAVTVYGHRYGSLKSDLLEVANDPDNVLLCDIASDAIPVVRRITERFGTGQTHFLSIYLTSPAREVLNRRLAYRGMGREEIEERLIDHETTERRELLSGMYNLVIHSGLPIQKIAGILKSLT